MTKKNILLSFDFEEFDVPREHGVVIPMEESMRISRQGAMYRHCGLPMLQRLDRFITNLKRQDSEFVTFTEYLSQNKKTIR